MENIVVSTEGFIIENLIPQIATIYPKYTETKYNGFDNNILVLDFGEKKTGDLATCMLKLTGLKLRDTGASCGCTRPTFQQDEDGNIIVTIEFDPSKISRNVSKIVYLYTQDNKTIKINLVINK